MARVKTRATKAPLTLRDRVVEMRRVPASSLVPHDENFRTHPPDQKRALQTMLAEVGFAGVVMTRKLPGGKLQVIDGHLRRDLAGDDPIPVVVTDLTEDEARKLLVSYDPLGAMAGTDKEALKALLEKLSLGASDGFRAVLDSVSAAYHVPIVGAGNTDPDDVPEPPKKPVSKLGDLYLLGEHRLLCGDALDEEALGRLLDGAKARTVFTDPPYNVAYGDSKNPRHKIREIVNDRQSPDEWAGFCKRLAAVLKAHCDGDVYVWGASGPDGMLQRLLLVEAGAHWSATIVWKKQQLVLSPANYQRMYEPCFYGWFKKSSFISDRKQTEVWEVDRPHSSEEHPTMKPVALCALGIGNSSKSGDVVLDLFLGSGSTLIAAEQLGRRCFGVEIDPAYCDVIVERFEKFSGKKATRVR